MAASDMDASPTSCQQTFKIPPSEEANEGMHALSEEDLASATNQMLKDPVLQQIIWANVHMLINAVFLDVCKRTADIEHSLSKRMDRLEKLIGMPQNDRLPTQPSSCERQETMEALRQMEKQCRMLGTDTSHQPGASRDPSPSMRRSDLGRARSRESSSSRGHSDQDRHMPGDAARPFYIMPSGVSLPMSSPRSSTVSTPPSKSQRSGIPQPSTLAPGLHSDHNPFRLPVPRRGRQVLQDSGLTRNTSYEDMRGARLHQEHQGRYVGQGDTRGGANVVPEQGRRTSPYVIEDNRDEAPRSDLPTTKGKRSGGLQQLMGRHTWWSSRKKS